MSQASYRAALPRRLRQYSARVPDFFTYAYKDLADGREVCVVPLITGTARITIGPTGGNWYDDGW